ncbi:MAG TPA: HAMP domain-containing sensor histidine kinase [Nitrososphaeraceae archaeon]|nr:HAMP domain-containing sensor histidine kinase [Nitrososphaeraceae archaeon]
MYDGGSDHLGVEDLKVIHDSNVVLKKHIEILKSAAGEIHWIYHNSNTISYKRSGIFEILRSLKKSIRVQVLIQKTESNKSINPEIDNKYNKSIEVKVIEGIPTSSAASFFVVDRSLVFIVILKDNISNNFSQNIDSAILTTRSYIVSSYHYIFNLLWHQTDLHQHIQEKNLQLERKNEELIDLYSDLRISFEALAKTNKNLQSANKEIEIQKNKQIEFFNMAAHELRTPTQSILGYIEMIKNFPHNLPKYLEPLDRNLNRLYRLTEDLFYIAKIESDNLNLDKRNFDIIQLVNETLTDFINESKNNNNDFKLLLSYNDYDHHIHYKDKINDNNKIEKKGKQLFVNADRDRIQQVLYNLLNNSNRFTENGNINIKIRKQESDNDDKISVTIQDNGKGIDPEILPKLFTKFTSTSKYEGGTGLGLYISKKIIEEHGGKIWGRNKPKDIGQGAEFGFLLPLV